MNLFQVLELLDPQVLPERCKVHLACWNGKEEPLEIYIQGRFDRWQAWQARKNFERAFVVSLISLPVPNNWLFAGVHAVDGCEEAKGGYRYLLSRRAEPNEMDGRLVVRFERPGRQSYLLAEKWSQQLEVVEIRAERLRVAEFPGYRSARLTKQDLEIVVGQAVESWRSALANVAGVYVIADRRTGKLYVGSATGTEGIWNRWCAYSATGHGGNIELKELLLREGDLYAENFQFGVLEIADTHASADDILRRESYSKDLLVTRAPHGYNAN